MVEVKCFWCGGPCEIAHRIGGHSVECPRRGCWAMGPKRQTPLAAVNAWLKARGEHSVLPLADGMRVRLLADQGWIAGKVPVGSLGTVRVEERRNSVRYATVVWDEVAPVGGGLGGDAFGLHSAEWWPHFLELASLDVPSVVES